MSPYDPLNPFAVGIPGDPMEEVLALQSYAEADAEAAVCVSLASIVVPPPPSCNSAQSVIVHCPSAESKIVIGGGTPK